MPIRQKVPAAKAALFNQYGFGRVHMDFVEAVGGADVGFVLLQRNVDVVDVVNTTAEVVVLAFGLNGGSLGTNKGLWIRLWGDYRNETGGGRTFTFQVKLGGFLVFRDDTASLASVFGRGAVWLDLMMMERNPGSVQVWGGIFGLSHRGPVADNGTWQLGVAVSGQGRALWSPMFAESFVDTSVSQVLEVTVKHSLADPALSFRRQFALIWRIE